MKENDIMYQKCSFFFYFHTVIIEHKKNYVYNKETIELTITKGFTLFNHIWDGVFNVSDVICIMNNEISNFICLNMNTNVGIFEDDGLGNLRKFKKKTRISCQRK